jgi:iron-sulfur cluster assembly protein
MAVQLTEKAAHHVQKMIEKRGQGIGLRLATERSGCSGFAYSVDYADSLEANDQVFESNGVKVVVDRESLANLDGTTVDYLKNSIGEGFTFDNPNVKNTCGCGESFNT